MIATLTPALPPESGPERLAKVAGFSLHAGVSAAAHQRDKIERLCRDIARPALASGRLALTAQGQVRYQLKTPYRDGTTHVVFAPRAAAARGGMGVNISYSYRENVVGSARRTADVSVTANPPGLSGQHA
jgi:hypothetical protein